MIDRRSALTGFGAVAMAARSAQAQATGPAAPIAGLNAALLQVMKAGHATPFAQRAMIVAQAVDMAFDLPTILRVVVGPKLATFSPTDQAALSQAFTRYTVDSYTANFDQFSGEVFTILPTQRAVGADRVVATTLAQRGGAPTRLDYVMRQAASGWRVVDILLDGSISRVAVQRSDYRSLVAQGAPALTAKLNQKSAALEAGAKG